MPIITLNVSPLGPILGAYLGVSLPFRAALASQNKIAPSAAQGLFLLDTGASHTSVDPHLIQSLGLQATGAIMTHTPSTAGQPVACSTYDVSLVIPGARLNDRPLIIEAMSVSESHFRAQGIDGLIGRDVLGQCVLNYNGPSGLFTLAY